MPKIAVDIALIPLDAIMDQAIAVNKTLQSDKQIIFLNHTDCLPHITLAMGVMDADQITTLAIRLVGLADQVRPVEILQDKIKVSEIASGVHFQKTPDLQALHEAIMNIIGPYFSYEATEEMFLSPPPIDKFPASFVKGFAQSKTHDQYDPHLTFGLGSLRQVPPQFNFTASRLAICHLGTYCTCRKILFETALTG